MHAINIKFSVDTGNFQSVLPILSSIIDYCVYVFHTSFAFSETVSGSISFLFFFWSTFCQFVFSRFIFTKFGIRIKLYQNVLVIEESRRN